MGFEIEIKERNVLFKKLINNLKEFEDQINFKFYEDKVHIQTMDNTKVCLSLLVLDKSFFNKWKINNPVVIGIYVTVFQKILKCCNDNNSIIIIHDDDDPDRLLITNGENSYRMPLVNIDEEQLNIQDFESNVNIKINVKESLFYENIKNIVSNGKTFKFLINSEFMNITTEDLEEDEPESSIIIRHSNNFKIELKENEENEEENKIEIKYSSSLINLMIKCVSLIHNDINLIIGQNNLIEFNHSDNMIKIHYYLAPKLD